MDMINIGGGGSAPPASARVATGKRYGEVELMPYDSKLSFRLNPKPRRVKRFKTGIEDFDKITGGGLPYGLSTFYGCAGSGKSLLARNIAKDKKCLYFACEVTSDAPSHEDYPNVDTVDYTRYLPNPERALAELFTFYEQFKPDMMVIDSLTTFFSKSRKALPESDVREMVSKLHVACDGVVPIIGISEIRGTGFSESPAGCWRRSCSR